MTDAITFFAAPVVLAILLVGIHAYLGIHVLERDVIFIDIGLSQVAALGGAISMFYTGEGDERLSLLYSLGLCLLVAFGLALLRRYEKKLSQEVLIGMTYSLASGLMILIADRLPHGTEHLKQALIGNILFVTWEQVLETAGVYTVIGCLHWIYRKNFWAASLDQGSFIWDFLFYVLFGIVITFSTHHAGVLVVFAILVAPAALASRFFISFQNRLFGAWLMGIFGVLLAFIISYKYDFPAGAGIVSVLAGGFFVILITALLLERRSQIE